jgi:hypothetical protein
MEAIVSSHKKRGKYGITNVSDIDPSLVFVMRDLFTKNGYSWPFDLIEAWKQKRLGNRSLITRSIQSSGAGGPRA